VVEGTGPAPAEDNKGAKDAPYEKRMRASERVEKEAADANPVPDENLKGEDISVRADYELPNVVQDRQEPTR
jgi:hypothetical protein